MRKSERLHRKGTRGRFTTLLLALILSAYIYSTLFHATNITYAQESQNRSKQSSQSQQSSSNTDNSLSFFNVRATDILAIIVAILSAAFSAWIGFRYFKLQKRFDTEIDFRARIRNRTYDECLPLLFELINVAEVSLLKIVNIVEHAKRNELTERGKRFSSNYVNKENDYYRIHTFYTLLAPIAVFTVFQEKLTFYDLNIDTFIFKQYELGKQLVYCFSGDRLIRRILEDISNCFLDTGTTEKSQYYDVINESAGKNATTAKEISEDVYRLYCPVKDYDRNNDSTRQGLRNGELIVLAEFLIERDSDKGPRLKTFAAFRREYLECYADKSKAKKYRFPYAHFEIINGVFDDFTPERKPLLWIILLAQALIYQVLLKNQSKWHTSDSNSPNSRDNKKQGKESIRKWILDEVRQDLFEAIDDNNIRESETGGKLSKILDYSPESTNDIKSSALQKYQLLITRCFFMRRLEDIKESML